MKYLLILLFSFQALAIEVIPVNPGDTMPEKGYFVNEANMAELIRIQKQKENLEKQVITLEKLGQIKDQQIDLLQRNVDEQRKARYKEQLWSNFSGVAGFTLGVVLSSVAAYATIKTLK